MQIKHLSLWYINIQAIWRVITIKGIIEMITIFYISALCYLISMTSFIISHIVESNKLSVKIEKISLVNMVIWVMLMLFLMTHIYIKIL